MKLQDYSCRINENSIEKEPISSDLLSSEKKCEETLDVSLSEDFVPIDDDENESQDEIPQEFPSGNNTNENKDLHNHSLTSFAEKENHEPNSSKQTPSSKFKARDIHNKTDNFLNILKAKKKVNSKSSTYDGQTEENYNNNEIILIEDNTNKSSTLENSNFEICEVISKPKIIYDDNSKTGMNCLQKVKSKDIQFSLDHVRQKLKYKRVLLNSNKTDLFRKFRAQISPTDNQTAEEELKREISKESFNLVN